MADATELVMAVKKASVDAVNASKPVEICFGTVIGIRPLRISAEQRLILGEEQLVVPRHITEHEIQMTVDHCTENELDGHSHRITGSEAAAEETVLTHCHKYKGRKSFIVHNGLAQGDEVILLRQQGGQKYIVWDKLS